MFDRMKNLVTSVGNNAFNAAEEKLRPELKGVNALAEALALLVMADRVAEEDELEAVSEYLIDMDVVIQKNLVREISSFFLDTVNRLDAGYKAGVVEGNAVAGEILHSISKVREDAEWSRVVADTVNLVTSGQGVDPKELKTRERILKALGK
ncbi:hypothetical protein NVP1084O_068 [Vibrio phage 1.084.O._10N.261.49.F5]|nr:hypothetical protein NVP1084O_068 [Vibrio phage 1.084.O._10N.261.49.F5]